MKVLLFGATGMVGQGVLRECLLAPDVDAVTVIGRTPTGKQDDKLREITHSDFTDFTAVQDQLAGHDACFFCLGVSSAGMTEADYTRMTYDWTMAAARLLVQLNPAMTFIYVSGAGTDSTERSGSMWARVKGKTENALLALPFKAAYMFRPGGIRPMHGEVSKTKSYRIMYAITKPLWPVAALFTGAVTTTESVGRAMLRVTREGSEKKVLETRDINALAKAAS